MSLYGTLPSHVVDGETINAIKVSIPNPHKVAYVRLPTPDEMMDYYKPAKTKKDLTQEQKDLELFKAIRVAGDEFDEWEASTAVETLTRSKGGEYEKVGSNYIIDVETTFGITKHTLNIPTQKQLVLFRRNSANNYMAAVTTFYDSLVDSFIGYDPTYTKIEIPVSHKFDACSRVFLALDSLDPVIDPNL